MNKKELFEQMFVLVLSLLYFGDAFAAAKMPLSKMVVVIDPGHGGQDPGAHGKFMGVDVYEAPYVNDVALRLAAIVRAQGGTVFLTRKNLTQTKPVNTPAAQVLGFQKSQDIFTLSENIVVAGTSGMLQRLAVARLVQKKYPHHQKVFISVHFDASPNVRIEGVSFIGPEYHVPKIAIALKEEFKKKGRLRTLNGKEHIPLLASGDDSHGARRLYILNKKNPIQEKVLVELGNFANAVDVYRIRNSNIREEYAQIMAKALLSIAQ